MLLVRSGEPIGQDEGECTRIDGEKEGIKTGREGKGRASI